MSKPFVIRIRQGAWTFRSPLVPAPMPERTRRFRVRECAPVKLLLGVRRPREGPTESSSYVWSANALECWAFSRHNKSEAASRPEFAKVLSYKPMVELQPTSAASPASKAAPASASPAAPANQSRAEGANGRAFAGKLRGPTLRPCLISTVATASPAAAR